jgi:DNA polymerase bacteriophage-type
MSLDELDLIDLTVKKFTRPQLCLDLGVLLNRLDDVMAQKTDAIRRAGVSKAELLSNDKFAKLLLDRGAKLPYKTSPTTGRRTYAFAKSDEGLQALRKDPKLRDLVEARLAVKSTIEETRIRRLIDIGNVTGGYLNVPLLYYGAHPGRFSGRDKINLQNLGRGSALREAIIAPAGHVIIAADLAQIEARITACLAGQWDLVEQFANNQDVYANFASTIYGYKVTEETHPKERFVGKTGILSLGYQSGANKYFETMNYVFGVDMEYSQAEKVVNTYRQRYSKIPALWYKMQDLISAMYEGKRVPFGPVQTDRNQITLPNGMPLSYPDLAPGWFYSQQNGGRTNIYGGKLLENVVQALARIVMTTAELRLARHGLKAALSVHDELVFVVKEEPAVLIASVIEQVMSHPVAWMPRLPVKCKAKIGNNYGECK